MNVKKDELDKMSLKLWRTDERIPMALYIITVTESSPNHDRRNVHTTHSSAVNKFFVLNEIFKLMYMMFFSYLLKS